MVSVIIPVYNVEEYIERCVQSVIDQTFSDIEIILVDDGSKDNSGAICDRYANEDSRVLVIHKKNGGLSDARNVGIEKSHGEYITFVDGDDCISSDYVSYLFEIINTFNADIAVGQFWINRSTDSPSLPAKNQREHIETLKQDEALERLLHGKISVSATTKLFKRRLFEKVRFPVGKQFEDVGTTYKLIMNSNVIGVGNRYIYSYFMRPSSIVHQSFSLSKLDRVELAHQALIDIN